MVFFSTMTRRLPVIQRHSTRSFASYCGLQKLFGSSEQPRNQNQFLFAAIPLFLLSSASYNSFTDSPALAPPPRAGVSTDLSMISTLCDASERPLATSLSSTTLSTTRFLMSVAKTLTEMLSYVDELLTGGFMTPQTNLPVSPLGGKDSLSSEELTLGVQELSLLLTETFVIHGPDGPYCSVRRIKGLKSLFTGRNKIKFYFGGKVAVTVETVRHSHSYDIFRGKTKEKIGRIEHANNQFFFYAEPSVTSPDSDSSSETSKPSPIYTLDGEYVDRRFKMKNEKGEIVAKVKKQLIAVPVFDHYQVRVTSGMDPLLALVCTVVIDEELDEEVKDSIKAGAKTAAKVTGKAVVSVGKLGVAAGRSILSFFNPFE